MDLVQRGGNPQAGLVRVDDVGVDGLVWYRGQEGVEPGSGFFTMGTMVPVANEVPPPPVEALSPVWPGCAGGRPGGTRAPGGSSHSRWDRSPRGKQCYRLGAAVAASARCTVVVASMGGRSSTRMWTSPVTGASAMLRPHIPRSPWAGGSRPHPDRRRRQGSLPADRAACRTCHPNDHGTWVQASPSREMTGAWRSWSSPSRAATAAPRSLQSGRGSLAPLDPCATRARPGASPWSPKQRWSMPIPLLTRVSWLAATARWPLAGSVAFGSRRAGHLLEAGSGRAVCWTWVTASMGRMLKVRASPDVARASRRRRRRLRTGVLQVGEMWANP